MLSTHSPRRADGLGAALTQARVHTSVMHEESDLYVLTLHYACTHTKGGYRMNPGIVMSFVSNCRSLGSFARHNHDLLGLLLAYSRRPG